MCGIVGYIGSKKAKSILIDGLKSLEYRGYDSSGIAFLTEDSRVELVKSTGKISELEKRLESFKVAGASTSQTDVSKKFNSLVQERTFAAIETSSCGIGHTRWATHGSPNEINAHPHQDSAESITLVHNGIIKNYYSLKEELLNSGFEFRSETDTEVIAQLFSFYKAQGLEDLVALRQTAKRLEGSYAIAALIPSQKKILLAKNQSPLVIGVGEAENYVASDSSTVLQFTDKILKLKDGQVVELSADKIKVQDIEGNSVKIEVVQSKQSASIMEKGSYKHFLLKEIHEQPSVIAKILNQAVPDPKTKVQIFDNLNFDFKNISKISFVACGSAYHAALIGKHLIETWAKLPAEVNIASEYCTNPSLASETELVIGISQSGETADTIAAITNAKNVGAHVMAITNKEDSAIYELCSPNNYVTPAGIEVSVASTKAFTSQVLSLYLLAIKIAEDLGHKGFETIKAQLRELPLIIDQTIERAEDYLPICLKFSNYRDFLFLSRGVNYPIALEGALKLKELSYIHATGYPSGEMKHGPIAILDKNVPVLSIAINGDTELEQIIYKKTLSNSAEARARMSPSIVVACDNNKDVEPIFDEIIRIPNISQIFSPIVAVIPLQFLAYYIAEDLGKDVDQPRNLAKSVTVE